ncbi:uncharacterized protein DS421_19g662850 [Arachis hypogaea]|uniref:Uncharacterized protein n=1 Tax=Arachis hypogaea TaxID=3818 RepID=A0A6B9VD37_ARAHY|nr:uncharacterized protein DS421_19g662850 [Arachis hypogaea]
MGSKKKPESGLIQMNRFLFKRVDFWTGLELVILYGRFHNKFSFIYLNRESMILRVSMNFKELI